MATNPTTGAREWRPLDRVVEAARRHDQLLVISLGNQSGNCDDGHFKDRAWYQGGYHNTYTATGSEHATVSYWDWFHEIVSRYRGSTTVAMWEPVNEPEASDCAPGLSMDACFPHLQCTDGAASAAALREFFDVVGAEIKRIDPNHLVESGALGGTQCGWTGSGGAHIEASPGIDVASYHDYVPNEVLPGELAARVHEAVSLGKPLLVGEFGIQAAGAGTGCGSRASRLGHVRAKTDAMLAAGVAGALLWSWVPSAQAGCGYDVGPGDPVLAALRVQ